jgi:hypothetical protein
LEWSSVPSMSMAMRRGGNVGCEELTCIFSHSPLYKYS